MSEAQRAALWGAILSKLAEAMLLETDGESLCHLVSNLCAPRRALPRADAVSMSTTRRAWLAPASAGRVRDRSRTGWRGSAALADHSREPKHTLEPNALTDCTGRTHVHVCACVQVRVC